MKEVYSYQEIGTEIDQGKMAVFTSHPVARVTVQQLPGDRQANPEVKEFIADPVSQGAAFASLRWI
jgi:hypothetical protein